MYSLLYCNRTDRQFKNSLFGMDRVNRHWAFRNVKIKVIAQDSSSLELLIATEQGDSLSSESLVEAGKTNNL